MKTLWTNRARRAVTLTELLVVLDHEERFARAEYWAWLGLMDVEP